MGEAGAKRRVSMSCALRTLMDETFPGMGLRPTGTLRQAQGRLRPALPQNENSLLFLSPLPDQTLTRER